MAERTAHISGPDRLAVSQFTTQSQPFEEDLALFRRVGIHRVELCEDRLSTDPMTADRELKAVRDAGLIVDSVQAHVHAVFPDQMASEPVDPVARLDAFRRSMDRFVTAFPDSAPTFVLISGQAPQHDLARAREQLVQTAEVLAREAGDRNCRVAFEPLNPMLMNEDSFVCSWMEALNLVECVDHPAFGLVCDLWNVWQEPDILAAVRPVIDRVALVHVSDWRDGGPRRLNDRLVPGEGVIPLDAWGRMLREADYRGTVCVELLSDPALEDSYLHRELADVLAQSRRAVHAAGLC